MSFEKEMAAAMEGIERRAGSALGRKGGPTTLADAARLASARGAQNTYATQLARQTLPQEVHDTCMQTSSLVARVMDMADRLCGPVPTPGDTEVEVPPSGEFGKMRRALSATREGLASASDALDRIERELL